jgi:hypothetical protein
MAEQDFRPDEILGGSPAHSRDHRLRDADAGGRDGRSSYTPPLRDLETVLARQRSSHPSPPSEVGMNRTSETGDVKLQRGSKVLKSKVLNCSARLVWVLIT